MESCLPQICRTAAISEDVYSTRFLVKIESDTYYVNSICEGIFAQSLLEDIDSSNPEDRMRLLLQAMTSHVKLPVKKLQDSFASLRSETTKALGRDVINVVVEVAVYFGT